MLMNSLSCTKLSEVFLFSSISKNKDFKYNDIYDSTCEDDKMAPRFCTTGDYSRYHLRTPKQRRYDTSIDASTVTNKVNFLRSIGLEPINSFEPKYCLVCGNYLCNCDNINETEEKIMKYYKEFNDHRIKPCWVSIVCERCKTCGKKFKCLTDLNEHNKKRHKKRVKVVSKFGSEILSTRYVKKRHLKHPKCQSNLTNSDQINSESNNQLIQNTEDMTNRNAGKNLEALVVRLKRRLSCNDSQIDGHEVSAPEMNLENRRSSSAPSLGVSYDLPTCQTDDCNCCIRRRKSWDDNNNNSSDNYSDQCIDDRITRSREVSPEPPATVHRLNELNSISCQTRNWIQQSIIPINFGTETDRLNENDVIVLDDDNTIELSNELRKSSIQPPCYDLTDDESYKSDNEVQKICEVRKNQLPFTVFEGTIEGNDRGLRLSDAIRDLIVAENSLSNHSQENLRVCDKRKKNYESECVNSINDDDDDDDDDFCLRYSDEEESCTFVINDPVNNKDYSKSYNDDFFDDTQLEMAVDHHDSLEKSSNFWQSPTKNVERFAVMNKTKNSNCQREKFGKIKEELLMDHYIYDRD